MSAAVCGKRSLFDDLLSSPPIAKRLRFAQGNSPIRVPSALSPSSTRSGPPFEPRLEAGLPRHPSEGSLLAQLHALFPEMEDQVVEKVLESSNNDLDYAIKSLTELRLSTSRNASSSGHPSGQDAFAAPGVGYGDMVSPMPSIAGRIRDSNTQQQTEAGTSPLPIEGGEWVELLVREMTSASDLNDARARAMHTLEAFENIVQSRSSSAIEGLQKENALLREQQEGLLKDSQILKRAVAIYHERQLEHEGKSRELQHVKQLLAQYQEQVRTLELNNYSLTLHLRQAQEGSTMPGRFHPDVF